MLLFHLVVVSVFVEEAVDGLAVLLPRNAAGLHGINGNLKRWQPLVETKQLLNQSYTHFVPTPENLSDEVFQDFLNIDQDLEICGELTDTEITQEVKRRRLCTDDTDHETDEDDDLSMPVASRKDVNTALQTLRSFLQMNSMESSRLDLKNIEASIMDHYKTKATQRSITHFFPSSQKSITVSSPPSPTLSIDYDSYPDPPSPTESVTFYNFYPESSSP